MRMLRDQLRAAGGMALSVRAVEVNIEITSDRPSGLGVAKTLNMPQVFPILQR